MLCRLKTKLQLVRCLQSVTMYCNTLRGSYVYGVKKQSSNKALKTAVDSMKNFLDEAEEHVSSFGVVISMLQEMLGAWVASFVHVKFEAACACDGQTLKPPAPYACASLLRFTLKS